MSESEQASANENLANQKADEKKVANDNNAEDSNVVDKIFVARQPIFDAQQRPCAFELLYRDSGSAKEANISDPDKATLQMITEGFFLGRSNGAAKPVFINFTENMLIEGHAEVLPASKCVIEILEGIEPKPENVEVVKKLKGLGYKIALDDFSGNDEDLPWLELADIVKIEVLAFEENEDKIKELTTKISKHKCRLLAEKVESIETFKMLRALGFFLFQGYFFCKPEMIEGQNVSSGEITKVKILKELGSKDFEVKKISELLHTDTSLSFKLFRYINSAGMGFRTPINTLDRAITLLGQRKLVQWLRVLMLYDLGRSQKAEEVVFTSIQRAKFLELVSGKIKAKLEPEAMFLLGMFSLLDVLLGQPIQKVVDQISLDEDMKAALTGLKKNQYFILLEIIKKYEKQEWQMLQAIVGKLGLEMKDFDTCYTNALQWANQMVGQ